MNNFETKTKETIYVNAEGNATSQEWQQSGQESKKQSKHSKLFMTTREIAFAAICVALSYALSLISIPLGANGGAVTLASALPILLFGYVFGIKKGLLLGLVFAATKMIQQPFFLNFFQLCLDYILPFAIFGLASILKKLQKSIGHYNLILSTLLFTLIAVLSTTLSGVLYWSTPWWASLSYNLLYNGLDFAILAVVIVILIETKTLNKLLQWLKKD